jgi:hypothetical protein
MQLHTDIQSPWESFLWLQMTYASRRSLKCCEDTIPM